jgi:hypothetical protein
MLELAKTRVTGSPGSTSKKHAKMQTATITSNDLPAVPSTRDNQHWLTIPCPDGWDDVRKITGKVLRFAGKTYVFRGWNSDQNEAYFIAAETAKIIR